MVKIGSETWTLRNRDSVRILDYRWIERKHPRMSELLDKEDADRTQDAVELSALVERTVRILLDAPEEVHGSLQRHAKDADHRFFFSAVETDGSEEADGEEEGGKEEEWIESLPRLTRFYGIGPEDHTSAPRWRLSRIRGNAASPDGRRVDASSAACSDGERDDRRERFQAHTAGVGRTSEPATKGFKRIEGSALRPQRNGTSGYQSRSGEIQ